MTPSPTALPWALPAAALLSVALAGCASAPVPTAPPPPVAAAWQATLPSPDTPAADTRVLGATDPVLQGLVDAAQQASPLLAQAAERIAAARSLLVSATAAGLPLSSAQAGVSQGRSDPSQPTTRLATLGAQANWEIDLFGRLAAGGGAARSRVDAALAAWHDGRVSLAAEVASAYVTLRACEAQLQSGDEDMRSRAETARLTGLSAAAGFVAPADAALARAGAAQARSQQAQLRLACERQWKALVALTAIDEPTLRARLLPGTAQVPDIAPAPLPGVPAQLLAQRPDLVEAQARLQAAAADVVQNARERLPRLTLAGNIGWASASAAGFSSSGSTWSFGPLQLAVPIFEGGQQAARRQAALAAYDSQRALLEAQVRDAVRDVEQALLALATARERQADARLAADGFDAALRATQARQRGGLASLFELEDARRQALAARSALVELAQQRALAAVALFRALGGGWATTDAGPAAPRGPQAAQTP